MVRIKLDQKSSVFLLQERLLCNKYKWFTRITGIVEPKYVYGPYWQEMWVCTGSGGQQVIYSINSCVTDYNEYYLQETIFFFIGIIVQYVTVSSADSIRLTSLQTIMNTGIFMLRWRRFQNGLLRLKRDYDRKNITALPGR
jgi:hypothetical protein